MRFTWSSTPTPVIHPQLTTARDEERADSAEILAQAQWLYEQHERRVQNCQTMALGVLTVVGTIMAITPTLLPDSPPKGLVFLAGMVGVTGLGTIIHCIRVLTPRLRPNGLPSVGALREFAHIQEHEPTTNPIPATQFVVDLLNPLTLTAASPLSEAAQDAKRRTDVLTQAYLWFVGTFVFLIATTTTIQFIR